MKLLQVIVFLAFSFTIMFIIGFFFGDVSAANQSIIRVNYANGGDAPVTLTLRAWDGTPPKAYPWIQGPTGDPYNVQPYGSGTVTYIRSTLYPSAVYVEWDPYKDFAAVPGRDINCRDPIAQAALKSVESLGGPNDFTAQYEVNIYFS